MSLKQDTSKRLPLLMSDYDFDLPQELIAQQPLNPRDSSRLLVLDRVTGAIEHRVFRDIVDLLRRDDLLVINDTRVFPARLHGRRTTGGKVELLLLRREADGRWQSMARPARRLKAGSRIHLLDAGGQVTEQVVTVHERLGDGLFRVELPPEVEENLSGYGEMPLPPYITTHLDDPERYQTIFATEIGSAAAPTAGLHFTQTLLEQIQQRGVSVANVTLHVGLGTFMPVKVEDAHDHTMHSEWYSVPRGTLAAIEQARARGGRVIAVGTTCCRTLESLGDVTHSDSDESGWTDLFIYPGFRFQVVDGLITNFHLPRSTLLLLVSALAGRDHLLAAYNEAIERSYRFFSFGDAMFIH